MTRPPVRSFVCDRCQKFYNSYEEVDDTLYANALYLAKLSKSGVITTGPYELCEDCAKELKLFLDYKLHV